jgi:hypothetical protein
VRAFAAVVLALAISACAPRVSSSVPTALPDPTAREWTRLRERLAIARSEQPERPFVANVVVALREPRTGRVFQARGAVAIDPKRALRMILVGPGGVTALDAWVTDDQFRFAVPGIRFVRRGGADAASARGLPIGFFRWWMLHPLDGRLLAAWTRDDGSIFLLRRGDETVILREGRLARSHREHLIAARREEGRVERLEWFGRSPVAPHAGDKARYVDAATGLEVEVLVEGVGEHEPDPAAFLDPDAVNANAAGGAAL